MSSHVFLGMPGSIVTRDQTVEEIAGKRFYYPIRVTCVLNNCAVVPFPNVYKSLYDCNNSGDGSCRKREEGTIKAELVNVNLPPAW